MSEPMNRSSIPPSDAEIALLNAFWGSADDPEIDLDPELLARYVTDSVTSVEREVVEAAMELSPTLAQEIAELRDTLILTTQAAPEVRLINHFFMEAADFLPDLEPDLLARFVLGDVTSAEREVVEAAVDLSPTLRQEVAELQETKRVAKTSISVVTPLHRLSDAVQAFRKYLRQALTLPSLSLAAGAACLAALLTIFWHGTWEKPVLLPEIKASSPEVLVKNDTRLIELKAELERVKQNAGRFDHLKDNQVKMLQAHLQKSAQKLRARNQQIARLKVKEGRSPDLALGAGSAPTAPRTADGAKEEIRLISPVNTKVRADQPILRWASLSKTQEFKVSWFLVRDNRPIVASVKSVLVQGNEYRLPLLNRGQAYGWEVEPATQDSTTDSSPSKSRTAYFTVLDANTWKKIKIRDEQYRRDAEAYMNAGLLDSARHVIALLDVEDPVRTKLLERLKTLE